MWVIYFHSCVFGTAGSWLILAGLLLHLQGRWGLCLGWVCQGHLDWSGSTPCVLQPSLATGGSLGMSFSGQWKKHKRTSPISSFHACIIPPNILLTKPLAWLNPESWRAKLCGQGHGFRDGWSGAIDVISPIPPWVSSTLLSLLISSHCFLFDAAIALGTSLFWLGS